MEAITAMANTILNTRRPSVVASVLTSRLLPAQSTAALSVRGHVPCAILRSRRVERRPELDREAYDPAEMKGSATESRPRAAIANLGCKVNLAEMGAVERMLLGRGAQLVDLDEPADLVIVNTCAVTAVADRKSRQMLRRVRRASPNAAVFVTGCSVAVNSGPFARADPSARLYGTGSKAALAADVAAHLDSHTDSAAQVLQDGGSALGRSDCAFGRTRAFVKVQDGCSFRCTYCLIPTVRGEERSMPADGVLDEIRLALAEGHREVVLTGINVGSYSDGDVTLPRLVRRILEETSVERVRLSSVEPQHVTSELLDVWADSGDRCLPHFHVPLQSGDDTILRRMGRRYDTAYYAALIERVRRTSPGAAVHADLIVGFPGEDEAAWSRTAEFLSSLDLAGVHVFRYSPRPGTPAARMIGRVDATTQKRRAAEALTLAADAAAKFACRQLGRDMRVLFEGRLPDGRWLGHAESHVLVAAPAPDERPLHNAICVVRAESIDPDAADRIAGRVVV